MKWFLQGDGSRNGPEELAKTPEEREVESRALHLRMTGRMPEEDTATWAMAEAAGHVVMREKQTRGPQRAVCTCGWATHWTSSREISILKRAHLKDSAIGGTGPAREDG